MGEGRAAAAAAGADRAHAAFRALIRDANGRAVWMRADDFGAIDIGADV
ncbi:LysR family transcriptional regulator, partial [Burkholderia pseudomallei]|nr:LysR family transcriptional regulator [Burkholderia pseudomallei]